MGGPSGTDQRDRPHRIGHPQTRPPTASGVVAYCIQGIYKGDTGGIQGVKHLPERCLRPINHPKSISKPLQSHPEGPSAPPGQLRIRGFGFRISFEFRPSDFGFRPRCPALPAGGHSFTRPAPCSQARPFYQHWLPHSDRLHLVYTAQDQGQRESDAVALGGVHRRS
jgi:hypothetical protein